MAGPQVVGAEEDGSRLGPWVGEGGGGEGREGGVMGTAQDLQQVWQGGEWRGVSLCGLGQDAAWPSCVSMAGVPCGPHVWAWAGMPCGPHVWAWA